MVKFSDLGYQGLKEEWLTKKYLKAMSELTIFEESKPRGDTEVKVLREQNQLAIDLMTAFMETTGDSKMFDEFRPRLDALQSKSSIP